VKLKTLLLAAAIAAAPAVAVAQEGYQGLIDEIQERGTLRIGVADGPPYQFPDAITGEYQGSNIELAKQVAGILGVELEIVQGTWATLVTGLELEQYDVVMANLFATPERAVSVAFTDPYEVYGFHVMVAKDSPIQSLEELNSPDVSFGGVAGTVEAQYPGELFPQATVVQLMTEQANVGPMSVMSGQADAIFIDPGQYRILLALDPSAADKVRLLNDESNLLKPVSLSWAVRQDDIDMLNFLNVFIADRVNNGVTTRLRDEWFDKIATAS
jgi:polar amino acid transport system substrate-binding protein